MSFYDEHLERAINAMDSCFINLTIYSGKWDDKLKAEWDAAVLLSKPTILVIAGKDTKVPDFMENHPIVRDIIRCEKELTAHDREHLLKVIMSHQEKEAKDGAESTG